MKRFLGMLVPVLFAPGFFLFSLPAYSAEEGFDAGAVARKLRNPVADMISLPFQNSTNFGFGPGDDVQNILNIQPVWPFKLSGGLNLFTDGWYVTSSPIITTDWEASEGDKWVVPLGGGGRVFRAGKLPLNVGAQVYYNVLQPDFGPVWQLRAMITLVFPK